VVAFICTVVCLSSPLTVVASPDEKTDQTFPLHYRSAFTHYQKFSDQPTLSWREANDTVDKIGGWRFYAKEATLPDAAEASTDHKTHPQVEEPVKPSTSTTLPSSHEAKP
jgi:hypothetical protein